MIRYTRGATTAVVALVIGTLAATANGQSFTVQIPEVFAENYYVDDDPPAENFVDIDLETIPGIPRFNPAQGSLTSVSVSAVFDVEYSAFLDTNGILNTGSPHDAFASGEIDFVIGFSPFGGNSITHVASDFVEWSAGCSGIPTDMDGCQGFDEQFFQAEVSGSIDSEDLAEFIGTGTVGDQGEPGSEFGNGALSAFIGRPIAANFNLNNVGGAGVDLSMSITNGFITVEYFANDGSSPDTPLLPPPTETLGPEFDGVDCESSFCIPGTIDESGPGIDEPLFFDPVPAYGFDYEIVGGPNVAGIEIPAGFGDDLFELLVSTDGLNFDLFGTIEGDVFYDLTALYPDGVSHLRVLGIEPSANVDPASPDAFPTGLTFVSGSSQVGLVMTPIFVPEPSSALLAMFCCLGAIADRRRRT